MDQADSLLLLTEYSVAIIAVSLFWGWLPSVFRLTHTRTQMVTSFVAGVILCVALYYLLPHGMTKIPGEHPAETAVWWMLVGTVLMVVLLRVFSFHQHDFSHVDDGTHDHDAHGYVAVNPMSWAGLTMGLGLHTVTEGVTLGTSIRAEAGVTGLSLGVFLAIVLHKPLDALSITGTMRAAGLSGHRRVMVNVLFSLICPAAAFLTFWGVGLLGQWEEYVVGAALAFAAGALLCIALSDLLPEVHFHSHDRAKLTLAFFAGIALAYLLRSIAPVSGHGFGD